MKTIEKTATWLADQVREAFPKADIKLHQPGAKGTVWWVDIALGKRYVVVEWSKGKGFGVSTPQDDEPYGQPSSEHYADAAAGLARVLDLLATGKRAQTRREMELQALREHRLISQETLAEAMKVSQASVSKTERREDVLVSTLRGYIEGLGGELQVFARFPGETIELEIGKDRKSG